MCINTNLASPLLEFDLDEQNEANQRHDHEEGQEDTHVKIFSGLLWKRTATLSNNLHMDLVKGSSALKTFAFFISIN